MTYKLLLFGVLTGAALCAAPVQITINLSGGSFDRGLSSPTLDTGGVFTTASAACSGTGCANLSNLGNLNNLTFLFTVPSGSSDGSGSTATGTLTQAQDLDVFALAGESAFNLTSSITENITVASVLGQAGTFTGNFTLNWTGNASVQTRAATGTITLTGDIASIPEPSTALLLLVPFVGLVGTRKFRRVTAQ